MPICAGVQSALAVLVCSPRLLESRCHTVDQLRLVKAVCGLMKRAQRVLYIPNTSFL
jgi:hypothetical protein